MMIREELLHPIFAHFPIVMFALAVVAKSLEFFCYKAKRDLYYKFGFLSKFFIYSAPMAYLITIFLGDSALDIIKNDLCDLQLVTKHEEISYYALYAFLGALTLEVLKDVIKKYELLWQSAVLIALVVSNFYLFQSAHLGGQLVYEKGAAVTVAPKCN